MRAPPLPANFGTLWEAGHMPSSAYLHTGLPSCPTPGHASHFPHLYPHFQNVLPCDGCPLISFRWGQAAQVNRSSKPRVSPRPGRGGYQSLWLCPPSWHYARAISYPHYTLFHQPHLIPLISVASAMGVLWAKAHCLSGRGGHPPLVPHATGLAPSPQGHNRL